MTTILNLYGGPGTGKSTTAAAVFAALKQAGKNAELVREYVKNWAWEGRHPGPQHQPYFLGKQWQYESLLYGKVDYIVTDCPIVLSVMYAEKYSPPSIRKGVRAMVDGMLQFAASEGHRHVHVMLKRTKPFNPAGRYQTEEQAREMDKDIQSLLVRMGIDYVVRDTINPGLIADELVAGVLS